MSVQHFEHFEVIYGEPSSAALEAASRISPGKHPFDLYRIARIIDDLMCDKCNSCEIDGSHDEFAQVG